MFNFYNDWSTEIEIVADPATALIIVNSYRT